MSKEQKKIGIDRAGLLHPEDEQSNIYGPQAISDLPERDMAPSGMVGIGRWFYFHLTNLPTAVLVLSVIAALSVIGTVVPQREPFDNYVAQYGLTKARLLHRFGFVDIYHTIYFNLLLLWIGVSAVWCSYLRFMRTWKLQFQPRIRIRAATIGKMKHHRIEKAKDAEAEMSGLDGKLKAKGFRTYRMDQDSGAALYAARGMRRMWALVILHFGIITILGGALIGLIFGSNGIVRLEDGEKKLLTIHPSEPDFAVSQGINGAAPRGGTRREITGQGKGAVLRWLTKKIPSITLELELDQFQITYDKLIKPFPMPNAPELFKEFESYIVHQFTSHFSISRSGRTREKVISVNYPLHLDKAVFYQSAYNRSIDITAEMPGGDKFSTRVDMNVPFEVTPNGFRAVPPGTVSVSPFVMIIDEIKGGKVYEGGKITREIPPMARVRILNQAGATVGLDVVSSEQTLALPGMTLGIGENIYSASIFQYKRDPGLPLIYIGFLMVILGVLGTLYWRFQQVYSKVEGGYLHFALRSTGLVDDADKFMGELFNPAKK